VKVDPTLRRAAAAVPVNLRPGEPLRLGHAASLWAVAVGQASRGADEVKAARAAALAISALPDDDLRDAAESLSLPAIELSPLRALLDTVAADLFQLLAAHGDEDGGVREPRRARGPKVVGPPLGDAFRRVFGTWLSWDVFDPYSAAQRAWGAAACAADLDTRLSDPERSEESERLRALVSRWDVVSLLAIERCTAGSWLESDAVEDALAGTIEIIADRLAAPRIARPPGPRPPWKPLPIVDADWPVGMATRFETTNTQLQAKRRAERILEDERPQTLLYVDGNLYPNMVSFVVGGPADGYGDGAIVERDDFGRPKPGRPVGHIFKLRQARIILAYEPDAARWGLVSSYPTDEPLFMA
jgi:hypothetical protein